MIVGTLRVSYDLKTGKEIGKKVIDLREMSEQEYGETILMGLTGMTVAEAADAFIEYQLKKQAEQKENGGKPDEAKSQEAGSTSVQLESGRDA